MNKKESGVTIIALAITIIIMLILATISVSIILANGGLKERSLQATNLHQQEKNREELNLAITNVFLKHTRTRQTENFVDYLFSAEEGKGQEKLKAELGANNLRFDIEKKQIEYKGIIYEIDDNGAIKTNGNSNQNQVEEYREDTVIKFGDYINYDPLHSDLAGSTEVSQQLLSYTSTSGSDTEHGNGVEYYEQTFTAETGKHWRVIGVKGNKIEIIPEELLDTFPLVGALGYLYAEQELNEICKIYGYGYGADTTVGATYTIGGPAQNEMQTRTISGTGARSINASDINRILNVNGNANTTPTTYNSVYFPTINLNLMNRTESYLYGSSTAAQNITVTNNYYANNYGIDDTNSNSNIRDMISNDKAYWLASRFTCDGRNDYGIEYYVGKQSYNYMMPSYMGFGGTQSWDYLFGEDEASVCPVVTLRYDCVDISNPTEDSGKSIQNAWNLK